MNAYYNEYNPEAAEWLRELIKAGMIAAGEVDERSILDVKPYELRKFTQCHFFAGIGGWSYALRLAGWPDDRPVWTGSCPCQPFSKAGKGKGFADERHLWPAWFWLISQSRPDTIFGEQVATKTGDGWFDLVRYDLEKKSYAIGLCEICPAAVGAPHRGRERNFFVADSNIERQHRQHTLLFRGQPIKSSIKITGCGKSCGAWLSGEWQTCKDGRKWFLEPGIEPLAHGLPERMGLLRGYGNAIVPQVAAEVIKAYMEAGYEI